ncbi:MAG: AMP-binding protein [Candidatus Sungbacteria bacterium]|nr:AMP-binding protein [Candidatus Sungbacteria bacterium]
MTTLLDLLKSFQDRGGKTAFVYRTGVRRFTYSYGDLYQLSLKMSHWLHSQGIQEGDRVVLWAPNSPWWAVAYWGILARGAIVVPVDFVSGKDRALSIADASESKFIIQSQQKLEKVDAENAVFIEDLEYLIKDFPETGEEVKKTPEDIAEIVFTSGTTGDPKGVVLTHKNILANIAQLEKHIYFDEQYNFLSVLPLSHMFEQMAGFLVSLSQGAKIVYLRVLKPSALMAALAEEDIYTLILVPRLLLALKNSIERKFESAHLGSIFRWLQKFARGKPEFLQKIIFYPVRRSFGKNFKFFVSGGAALDPELFSFWQNMGFLALEGYGLTECSPVLAANPLETQVAGSVGKPLEGIELKILDGEIFARGDNIFQGYWRNANATREIFTKDRWFKTGDLGTMDKEGNLYIKGRSKDLIVTGAGVNVYPDDVENILNKIEGVQESCVLGMDTGEGEEVHAALLLKPGAPKPEDIILQANERLDPTQRITGFSVWPKFEFPKTATMKIQKFRVKEFLQTKRAARFLGDVDHLIALIGKVTAKNAEEIKEDSLLVTDLGLTSIGRLELAGYIEQEFRLDLEDTAIKQNTSVGDLRKIIQKRERYEEKDHLRMWTNSLPIRIIRTIVDYCLHIPVRKFLMDTTIEGAKGLEELKGPALFISNHVSFFDAGVIMYALPFKIRSRFATAAWEEFYFANAKTIFQKTLKRLLFEHHTIFFNAFMISQVRGFKKTLEFMGKLIDRKINILYFPEGSRTWDDKMLPFEAGLGIVVKELKVPVVPIKLKGLEKVLPRGAAWPKRGRVSVTFGPPLYFTKESPSQINEISRKAVLKL